MPLLISSSLKKLTFFPFHCVTMLPALTYLLTGKVWPCPDEGDISKGPNLHPRNFRVEELFLQCQRPNSLPIPRLPTKPPQSKGQVNSFKLSGCDLIYLPMHQAHGGLGTCFIAKESYFLIFLKQQIYFKKLIFITHFLTCTLYQSK